MGQFYCCGGSTLQLFLLVSKKKTGRKFLFPMLAFLGIQIFRHKQDTRLRKACLPFIRKLKSYNELEATEIMLGLICQAWHSATAKGEGLTVRNWEPLIRISNLIFWRTAAGGLWIPWKAWNTLCKLAAIWILKMDS